MGLNKKSRNHYTKRFDHFDQNDTTVLPNSTLKWNVISNFGQFSALLCPYIRLLQYMSWCISVCMHTPTWTCTTIHEQSCPEVITPYLVSKRKLLVINMCYSSSLFCQNNPLQISLFHYFSFRTCWQKETKDKWVMLVVWGPTP